MNRMERRPRFAPAGSDEPESPRAPMPYRTSYAARCGFSKVATKELSAPNELAGTALK
jgi:hypothetical protein